jgi:hypothetical protein
MRLYTGELHNGDDQKKYLLVMAASSTASSLLNKKTPYAATKRSHQWDTFREASFSPCYRRERRFEGDSAPAIDCAGFSTSGGLFDAGVRENQAINGGFALYNLVS